MHQKNCLHFELQNKSNCVHLINEINSFDCFRSPSVRYWLTFYQDLKMRLLQSIQKYIGIIGIHSQRLNPNNQKSEWNWKIIAFFICMGQMFLSSIGFLLIHAKTAAEYGFSFCAALNGFVAIVLVSIFSWKYESKIKLVQRFEEFIHRSEYGNCKAVQPYYAMFTDPPGCPDRNARVSALKACLRRPKRQDRTTHTADLCVSFQICHARVHSATADDQFSEILHLWFGRRIIWSASSYDVNMWIIQIGSEFKFDACLSPFETLRSLPYKSHPPVGYVIVWFIEFMSNFCLILCFAGLMCYTISECWLIIEFIKDILSDWNDSAVVSKQNDRELKTHFCKIVQSHWNIKELSAKAAFYVSVTALWGKMFFFSCS